MTGIDYVTIHIDNRRYYMKVNVTGTYTVSTRYNGAVAGLLQKEA